MNKFFKTSFTAALAAAGAYSYATWQRMSPLDTGSISTQYAAPKHLAESTSVKSIVNPKDYVYVADVRSTSVQVAPQLSDELILARFVKGFFGGYVFFPESVILKTAGMEFTKFPALKDVKIPWETWSQSQVSDTTLPPLHSMLFGAFQVTERSIAGKEQQSSNQKSQSHVDFAFGSDTGGIAGVHRFSVFRDAGAADNSVRIEFSCLSLDPSGKPLGPEIFMKFHLAYAMLLFREAVSNVIKE